VLPDDGDLFFAEVQDDYAALRATPNANDGPPPTPDAVTDLGDEIAASGRFRNVGARRYTWDVTYCADDYLATLNVAVPQRGRGATESH
jgi:hypothetical protein